MFVFAAGGDLHREPALDEPAVTELARDLIHARAMRALLAASDSTRRSRRPRHAWRAYACGLLADALGEE
jgi:hypothetical protein